MLGLTFSTAVAWASASRASEDDIYDDDVYEDGDKNRPVLPFSPTNNTTNAGSILSLIDLIITVGTQFDKDMIGIKFGSWVLKLHLCKKFIHHIQVESLSHPISMLPWLKSLSSIFKQIPRVESQSAVFSNSRWLIMINALIWYKELLKRTNLMDWLWAERNASAWLFANIFHLPRWFSARPSLTLATTWKWKIWDHWN